jgi:PadR family transcriptional regulator, regulatory protein PadR
MMLGMRAETLKGHLDLLLLTVVADGPKHGYAVIEQLRALSGDAFDLPEGTVYPALHRLERAGLLASAWEVVGGRRRRVYQLTAEGGAAIARQRGEWHEFAQAMRRVVEGTPWPEPT